MNRNILTIQGEMKGWYEPPHTLAACNRLPIDIDMFRTRFSTIVNKTMFGTRDSYTEFSLEPGGSNQFTFHTQTPNVIIVFLCITHASPASRASALRVDCESEGYKALFKMNMFITHEIKALKQMLFRIGKRFIQYHSN